MNDVLKMVVQNGRQYVSMTIKQLEFLTIASKLGFTRTQVNGGGAQAESHDLVPDLEYLDTNEMYLNNDWVATVKPAQAKHVIRGMEVMMRVMDRKVDALTATNESLYERIAELEKKLGEKKQEDLRDRNPTIPQMQELTEVIKKALYSAAEAGPTPFNGSLKIKTIKLLRESLAICGLNIPDLISAKQLAEEGNVDHGRGPVCFTDNRQFTKWVQQEARDRRVIEQQ